MHNSMDRHMFWLGLVAIAAVCLVAGMGIAAIINYQNKQLELAKQVQVEKARVDAEAAVAIEKEATARTTERWSVVPWKRSGVKREPNSVND